MLVVTETTLAEAACSREGRAVLPDYIGEFAAGESHIVRRQADRVVDG
jgi:hypothetical protein